MKALRHRLGRWLLRDMPRPTDITYRHGRVHEGAAHCPPTFTIRFAESDTAAVGEIRKSMVRHMSHRGCGIGLS